MRRDSLLVYSSEWVINDVLEINEFICFFALGSILYDFMIVIIMKIMTIVIFHIENVQSLSWILWDFIRKQNYMFIAESRGFAVIWSKFSWSVFCIQKMRRRH